MNNSPEDGTKEEGNTHREAEANSIVLQTINFQKSDITNSLSTSEIGYIEGKDLISEQEDNKHIFLPLASSSR